MSRCTIKSRNPPQYIVCGLDPMLQEWFGQLWDPREETEDSEGCLKTFETRSQSKIISKLMEWGADKSDPYTKQVLDAITLDLDPGTNATIDEELLDVIIPNATGVDTFKWKM